MKQRILFLCLGNSCRSQMAEAFARAYGHDVIDPVSAGLTPALQVDPRTRAVMAERGISLDQQFPKPLEEVLSPLPTFLINLSGAPVPRVAASIPTEAWTVRDPVGSSEAFHREVRDDIEARVMQLILRLRQHKPDPSQSPRRFKFGRMA
jgi:arsenate reductase